MTSIIHAPFLQEKWKTGMATRTRQQEVRRLSFSRFYHHTNAMLLNIPKSTLVFESFFGFRPIKTFVARTKQLPRYRVSVMSLGICVYVCL